MSGLNIQQQQRPQGRHPLYVSIQNGTIHRAMTSPSGYEDEHPEDWRPATLAEREQYLAGVDNINGNPQPQPIELFDGMGNIATPQSLTLQADDPVPVNIIQPVAPAAPPLPPVVPVQTHANAAPAPAADGALSVGAPPPAPSAPPAAPPAAPPPPPPAE